jgi:hypothetical protein
MIVPKLQKNGSVAQFQGATQHASPSFATATTSSITKNSMLPSSFRITLTFLLLLVGLVAAKFHYTPLRKTSSRQASSLLRKFKFEDEEDIYEKTQYLDIAKKARESPIIPTIMLRRRT